MRYYSDLSSNSRVPFSPEGGQIQAISIIDYKGETRESISRILFGRASLFKYVEGIYIRELKSNDSLANSGDGNGSAPRQVALGFHENQWYLFYDNGMDGPRNTDWVSLEQASPVVVSLTMTQMLLRLYAVRCQQCMQENLIFSPDVLKTPTYQKVLRYVLNYYNLTEKDMPSGIIPKKYWIEPARLPFIVWGDGDSYSDYTIVEPLLKYPLPDDIKPDADNGELRGTSTRMRRALIDADR